MKHKILLILVVIALTLIPLSCTQEVVPPQDWDVANETEFLAKCEQCNLSFEKFEFSDGNVYYHQRIIGSAAVLGDSLNYQFDKDGSFEKKLVHWRDDLPDKLPEVISEDEAMTIGGGNKAFLVYIDPESAVFASVKPTPRNPCWAVSVYDNEGWNTDIVVVDATSGEIVGHGVPIP